jgi:RNA polymerase sigma factor (sigma-70 family)
MLVVIESSMSKRLRAHCSADDIWQETLSQAWASRAQHRWESVSAYRAWLFEIARNRIRDAARHLETEKRGEGRPASRFSELGGTPSASISAMLPADSVTPSRNAMHAEHVSAMQRALAELPPDLEPVVRMHLLEDLTMEVVAERLQIGVSAAWRRYRKGAEIYSSRVAALTGGQSAPRT